MIEDRENTYNKKGFVTLPSMDTALAVMKSSAGQSFMDDTAITVQLAVKLTFCTSPCGRFSDASNGYHAPPWMIGLRARDYYGW